MPDAIVVALIAGGVSLIGTIITVLTANRKSQAEIQAQITVIQHDIKTLSDRVEKHNNMIERTYNLETRVSVLEATEIG